MREAARHKKYRKKKEREETFIIAIVGRKGGEKRMKKGRFIY